MNTQHSDNLSLIPL